VSKFTILVSYILYNPA